MNIKTWLWCLHCERAFSVFLSGSPDVIEDRFFAELEMQLGVEQGGEVYAKCPYDNCDGSPLDFWSWDSYRKHRPDAPEVPELEQEYTLYPE